MEERRNLYFVNEDDVRYVLATDVTRDEAWKIMHEFLKEHNFKSYYVRSWNEPNVGMWWDFGSHVQFMLWGYVNDKHEDCER